MNKNNKATDLRQLITQDTINFALEAHNGLSAKIVEDTGFRCIWASGLSISSSLGLRDCNEASWSQILDVTEFINDSVKIPVLFDGDSGFGNFNNVRYVVRKLSGYGIAGVTIEDKMFPKMNSFIGEAQLLTPEEEFMGKIKAAQDSKLNDDFVVIARTEALVSGLGLDVALRRAEKYVEAGADAIFIHSKKKDAAEILEFAKLWNKRSPIIVAPTTYADVSPDVLAEAGVSLYICANHLMRASLASMYSVAEKIKTERGISGVDNMISPLSTVFQLLDYNELSTAEDVYLPTQEVG